MEKTIMNMDFLEEQPYFLDAWRENVTAGPDRLFLTDEVHPRGITRRDTDELSAKVFAWLKKQGIGKEDFVLVCLPRGIMIPIAMMGVWKAGAAVTVVEDTYAAERIEFIRKDCNCKTVIDISSWEEIMKEEPLSGFQKAQDHDAALAVYTSGTTGSPKGVLHEYGNLKLHMATRNNGGKDRTRMKERFAFIAPLNFVAFYKNLVTAIVAGIHLFIVPYATVKNPVLLRRYFEEKGITTSFLSPSMIRALKGNIPSCVKMIFIGSEPANGIFLEQVSLLNVYVMSESFFTMAEFTLDKAYEICPVGKPPYKGISIRIIDEDGMEVTGGEAGEVCVEMPFFRGYIGLPEKTKENLQNGIFRTGDMAKRLPDGTLVILGRKDDMIKINGNRIEPAEIESVARKHLCLKWAAAKGFIKPDRSFIALYYTGETEINTEQARTVLKEFLPYYMIPSFFIHLDQIPLLPNGKLDKKSLPEPDISSFRTEYEAPANETEKRIVNGFEQILGISQIGVNEDFYELGGDSLCSIQVVEIVRDPLFTVPLLYQQRTARKAAAAILQKRMNNIKGAEDRDGNAREHDQPLIPIQLYLMDIQLFMPKATFCNLPVFWRMPKHQVDSERLLYAFREIIHNQPVLQSVIRIDPDVCFVQHYDTSLEPELTIEYLSEKDLEEIKDDLIQPFTIINRLIYRIRIFETEDHVYVFLDLNHLFNDGTSLNILIRNLSDAYHGRQLPPDRAYLFARDSNKWIYTDEYEDAKNRMLEKYGQKDWRRCITPDLESGSTHCASISCDFPAEQKALTAFLESKGLSLNELGVMAALMTLHEYEQKDDIMVSWAYSGRDQLIFKDTVFPMTKEFPVAVSFEQISTVQDLMKETKEQIQLGVACQMYPYIFINTTIDVDNPFRVRTLGTMRQFKGIEGIDCEVVPIVNKGAACALMNIQILTKEDGGQELVLTYNDEKYKKNTADKVLALFCKNTEKIMADMTRTEDK